MIRTTNLRLMVLGCLAGLPTCTGTDSGTTLPVESMPEVPAGYELLTRFVHISDAQVIDEESPARFAPADVLVPPAWRPHEAYSLQLLDGMIRAINHQHRTGQAIDFVILTGDAVDNTQRNEWQWLLDIFDGVPVDPLTGEDDRSEEDIPPRLLDPHAPFVPEGLYREGIHGPLPSIPWYAVLGNHDHFAIGVFPIFEFPDGSRLAPLPWSAALTLFFPVFFNPEGRIGFGLITPAQPGPPGLLNLGRLTRAVPDRRYLSTAEIISAHFQTTSGPVGHGFEDPDGDRSWYSTSPVPGLRLIVLDTSRYDHLVAMVPHVEGALSAEQAGFLEDEIQAAADRGEWVVVASHHPSGSLTMPGSDVSPAGLRELLGSHANVVLHLAGHNHRHHVSDQAGYLEIETGAIIDYPQEGRIIEIWTNPQTGEVLLRYRTFSHLDTGGPAVDPLYELRRRAFDLASQDAGLKVP